MWPNFTTGSQASSGTLSNKVMTKVNMWPHHHIYHDTKMFWFIFFTKWFTFMVTRLADQVFYSTEHNAPALSTRTHTHFACLHNEHTGFYKSCCREVWSIDHTCSKNHFLTISHPDRHFEQMFSKCTWQFKNADAPAVKTCWKKKLVPINTAHGSSNSSEKGLSYGHTDLVHMRVHSEVIHSVPFKSLITLQLKVLVYRFYWEDAVFWQILGILKISWHFKTRPEWLDSFSQYASHT